MSFADFVAMGGYGFYVWSAWGISLMALLVLGWGPYRQHKRLIRQIQTRQRRQQLLEQTI